MRRTLATYGMFHTLPTQIAFRSPRARSAWRNSACSCFSWRSSHHAFSIGIVSHIWRRPGLSCLILHVLGQESQFKVFLEFVDRGLDEKKVMKNGLNEKVAVLFNEWKAQSWLEKLQPEETCSIVKIPQNVRTAEKGFAVPKGSSLKKFLNFQ